jgi:predicted ABC-type ATPase
LPAKKSSTQQLRLRVFAGPNGSGKSTIINKVKETKQEGKPIDFGSYINADEITQKLRKNGSFSFSSFRLKFDNQRLIDFVTVSGLLRDALTLEKFKSLYTVQGNSVQLAVPEMANEFGQVLARFLREEMLRLKRRFSFETVFSHESNLDIMRRAKDAGYKVYLYFVSTESAEINKYRVALRVKQGGHDVPPQKIEDRYIRSLELMYSAAELSYQAFFFDNSQKGMSFVLVAHFKVKGAEKIWDPPGNQEQVKWFRKYYRPKLNE